jgi:phage shock protein PspC (stress-responsive transcriptional regulator)
MNKTISIHISGILFNIEEDAYAKLNQYLNAIRASLGKTEDVNEIMNDIELRVAELFLENKEEFPVVTDVLLEKVIAILGQPEDFAEEAFEEPENFTYTSSGKSKRIFRNPDNKVIGGVCAGLGSYFAIDPLWVRILFVLSFLGYGFGFGLYFILWIIIPEAKTTADKLQMEGEDVTIENIKTRFHKEKDDLGKNLNDIKNNWRKSRSKRTVSDASDFLQQMFSFFFKALGKVASFALYLGSIAVFACIVWGAIALIFQKPYLNISPFHGEGNLDLIGVWLFDIPNDIYWFLLAVGICLVSVFLSLLSLGLVVGKVKQNITRPLGLMAVTGLIISAGFMIYNGFNVGHNFIQTESHIIEPTIPESDTLFVYVNGHYLIPESKSVYWRTADQQITLNEKNAVLGSVYLYVRPAKNGVNKLEITQKAKGFNDQNAFQNAQDINYEYSFTGDTLNLSNHFELQQPQKYRAQKVQVRLYLKEGQVVKFVNGIRHLAASFKTYEELEDEANYIGMTVFMGEKGLKKELLERE